MHNYNRLSDMNYAITRIRRPPAMFDDKRSKKLLLVAHCILNQNAKIDRCACFPGAIPELAHFLVDSGVGLIQMPCPELLCLGLDRQVEKGSKTTIESEDTRVALKMNEEQSVSICQEIIDALTYQLGEYRKNGYKILGAIGINGSPTCGVETTWSNEREMAGAGFLSKCWRTNPGRTGAV